MDRNFGIIEEEAG